MATIPLNPSISTRAPAARCKWETASGRCCEPATRTLEREYHGITDWPKYCDLHAEIILRAPTLGSFREIEG